MQMWRCASKENGRRGCALFAGRNGFVTARRLIPYSRIEHQEKQALFKARLTPGFQRRYHRVLASYGIDKECNTLVTPVCINSVIPRVHPVNCFSGVTPNLRGCLRAPRLLGPPLGEECQRRHLNTRQGGFPPRPSVPERIFAGAVFLFLAAWGLLFGAFTLLLLPFVGLALYLLRRDFQRGGPSRGLVASLGRKMAERAAGQFPAGNGGGSMAQWMQRAPTEGFLSTMLSQMLGGGIRGMQLINILRGEVKKRVRQNPGLINAIGGDIESFSDVEMSTVGTAGGIFGLAGGGGGKREGPSRVIKARLRFVGRRAGAGGAGWAEVEVSDWERERGDNGMEGLEYDRVNVTLDNGKTFDLTRSPSINGGPNWVKTDGEQGKDEKRRQENKKTRPVEAEFRNK